MFDPRNEGVKRGLDGMPWKGALPVVCLLVVLVVSPVAASADLGDAGDAVPTTDRDRCRQLVDEPSPVPDRSVDAEDQDRPAVLRFSITPAEQRVERGSTGVFLVCLAHPGTNDRTVSPVVLFSHSGDGSAAMHVVGRDDSDPSITGTGAYPLSVPVENGVGRFVYAKDLAPGEVRQFSLVVSDAAGTGTYDVRVETLGTQAVPAEAELQVVCPWSCAVGQVVGFVGGNLLAVLGLFVALAGVVLTLVGPQRTRSYLGKWRKK